MLVLASAAPRPSGEGSTEALSGGDDRWRCRADQSRGCGQGGLPLVRERVRAPQGRLASAVLTPETPKLLANYAVASERRNDIAHNVVTETPARSAWSARSFPRASGLQLPPNRAA